MKTTITLISGIRIITVQTNYISAYCYNYCNNYIFFPYFHLFCMINFLSLASQFSSVLISSDRFHAKSTQLIDISKSRYFELSNFRKNYYSECSIFVWFECIFTYEIGIIIHFTILNWMCVIKDACEKK